MNWSSTPQNVPVHLGRFAEQLRELSMEVRSSVAGLAGDAVGRAVRDVLLRFWQQSVPRSPHEKRDRYDWDRDEFDLDDPHTWKKVDEFSPPESSMSIAFPGLASMLGASDWLVEYGPWLLLLAGLGVGGVVMFKGHACLAGLDALSEITDLASLITLLASGAKHLGSL